MNPLIPSHKCVDFLPACKVPDGYGTVAVIGKNPAPFDARSVTLRRVIAAAEKWRLSPFLFNMFSLRGSPADIAESLLVDYEGTVGSYNNLELLEARDASLVVAAWGQPSGIDLRLYRRREAELMDLVGRDRFVCVGRTKEGFPLHPRCWPTAGALPVMDYMPRC